MQCQNQKAEGFLRAAETPEKSLGSSFLLRTEFSVAGERAAGYFAAATPMPARLRSSASSAFAAFR